MRIALVCLFTFLLCEGVIGNESKEAIISLNNISVNGVVVCMVLFVVVVYVAAGLDAHFGKKAPPSVAKPVEQQQQNVAVQQQQQQQKKQEVPVKPVTTTKEVKKVTTATTAATATTAISTTTASTQSLAKPVPEKPTTMASVASLVIAQAKSTEKAKPVQPPTEKQTLPISLHPMLVKMSREGKPQRQVAQENDVAPNPAQSGDCNPSSTPLQPSMMILKQANKDKTTEKFNVELLPQGEPTTTTSTVKEPVEEAPDCVESPRNTLKPTVTVGAAQNVVLGVNFQPPDSFIPLPSAIKSKAVSQYSDVTDETTQLHGNEMKKTKFKKGGGIDDNEDEIVIESHNGQRTVPWDEAEQTKTVVAPVGAQNSKVLWVPSLKDE